MKLNITVLKNQADDSSEIRIADPPFEPSDTVSISADGVIFVSLHSEEQIDVIRNDLELDDTEWFDCIQWSIELDALVADFMDGYRAGDALILDADARTKCETLAKALESAAAIVRSVLGESEC